MAQPPTLGRHLDFEGIENFRDFGGYDTACGRGLKAGVLYRSANHTYATDTDLERLRAMALAAVVDLRRPDERVREPSRRWPDFTAQVVESDIASAQTDWLDSMRGLAELTPQWFYQDGLNYYLASPYEPRHIDLFRRYFQTLAASEGPVVVHCAAGKDRTGLICALTHHLAGVHPDDMLGDYLLTNDESRMARKIDFLRAWLEKAVDIPVSDAALQVAVSVHPEYLEKAFQVIRATSGSIDSYLETLGVNASLRARLHERLLR